MVDKINRELVGVSLSFKGAINGNSYYAKTKVREERIWEYTGDVGNYSFLVQLSVELEYSIKESDGARINITMSNYNIRSLFESMKVNLGVLFNMYNPRIKSDFINMYYTEIELYLERMAHDKKRAEEKAKQKK